MWPVIRRNVRAPDRDVEGSPATPRFPPVHASSGELEGVLQPRQGTAPTGHNFTAWTHCASYLSAVPRRWRGRCLTGRHRHRWSDDRRIPPARCPRAPQAREIPRPAPDACSAGTRKWGGVVREERPRPAHLCSLFPLDSPAAGYALPIPPTMIRTRPGWDTVRRDLAIRPASTTYTTPIHRPPR
jgi:hypothetical protein